jgi:hypothetical protein
MQGAVEYIEFGCCMFHSTTCSFSGWTKGNNKNAHTRNEVLTVVTMKITILKQCGVMQRGRNFQYPFEILNFCMGVWYIIPLDSHLQNNPI